MKQLIESISKPVDVVSTQSVNDTLEILSKVNEFYDSSWNKLLWVLGGAFAVLAIFVPVAIQYLQNKSIKASEKELEGILNLRIQEAKKSIEDEMNLKLENKLKEHEESVNIKTSALNGQILHLQANSLLNSEDYKGAFRDYCSAVSYYSGGNDIPNISIVLGCINDCLVFLTKEDIFTVKNVEDVDIVEILNDLLEEQGRDVVGSMVRDVRAKLNELVQKEKEE